MGENANLNSCSFQMNRILFIFGNVMYWGENNLGVFVECDVVVVGDADAQPQLCGERSGTAGVSGGCHLI